MGGRQADKDHRQDDGRGKDTPREKNAPGKTGRAPTTPDKKK